MAGPNDMTLLLEALDEGDLEIRFHDGRSTKAHSQKLKLASRGVIKNLIEDVLDEQITGSKRKRTDSSTVDISILNVSPH
jgi:hypothetical protein